MKKISTEREGYQLSFFQLDDPVLKQIRDEINHLDVDRLTPVEALNRLNEIKRLVGGK
jgi:DNA mismatch repair protein MutS